MMEPAAGLGVAAAVAVGESAVAASIAVGYGVDGVGVGVAVVVDGVGVTQANAANSAIAKNPAKTIFIVRSFLVVQPSKWNRTNPAAAPPSPVPSPYTPHRQTRRRPAVL